MVSLRDWGAELGEQLMVMQENGAGSLVKNTKGLGA
jgi:hypothetical protein